MASLLHDSGKLILATRLPNEFAGALRRSESTGRPLHVVEAEQLGTSHAEVGAYLLGLWGLPGPIVEAVQMHHQPQFVDNGGQGLDAVSVTHIANGLAREVSGFSGTWLDREYIARLGAEEQLPGWRAMAKQVEQELMAVG